jgi:hypothetical protein
MKGSQYSNTNLLFFGFHTNAIWSDRSTIVSGVNNHVNNNFFTVSGWRVSGLTLDYEKLSSDLFVCYINYWVY